MSGKEPAEALLFDLGGVIMGLDWDRCFDRWAAYSATPAEVLRARYSFDEAYERHERGEIGELEYYRALSSSLGAQMTDAQWAAGWGAIFTEEITPIVQMVARVKERIPVYAFSNTNRAHQREWSRQFGPALAHFREVFVSSELGVRKPERESFLRVARRIGVDPGAILFFDDTPQNVEGARDAGLQAVLVRSPEDVARALRPWLVSSPT
ncbi:MAG TPA: HAD family phosphatase [Usitatibacter sp.]|jgi:putative hydrolase of the HAD superfamily|nr:HAD family phosphatase [Usitatibacter sp.]